jgi:hypothetical protein
VSRRIRSRAELLTAWRLEAEVEAAGVNEWAEAVAAAAFDAADPLLSGAPLTPDSIVRVWAREELRLELAPRDRIPPAIRTAFARAQAALWAGEPIPDAAILVDEPPPGVTGRSR